MITQQNIHNQALLSILKTLNSILLSIDPHFTILNVATENDDQTEITNNYLTDFPGWLNEQKHFPLNLMSLVRHLSDILILNTKLESIVNCNNFIHSEDNKEIEEQTKISNVFSVILEFLTIPSADVFSSFVKQMEFYTSFLAQKTSLKQDKLNLNNKSNLGNSRNSDITDSNQPENIHAHPTDKDREFKFYNSVILSLTAILENEICVCFSKETMPYLIKLIFPILKNFDINSRSKILTSISSSIFTNDHLVAKYETMHNFEVIINNISLEEFNLHMSDFFFSLCTEKNWRIRNISIPSTVLLIASARTSSSQSPQAESIYKRCVDLFKTHLKDPVLTISTTSGKLLPEFLHQIPAQFLDVELSRLLVEQLEKGSLECKTNCYKFFPSILSAYLCGPLKLKSSPDPLLENLNKFLLFNVALINNKLKGSVVTNCLPDCLQILNKYLKASPTSQHYEYLKSTVHEATEFYLLQVRKPEVFEYHGFEGFEKVYPFVNSVNRSMVFDCMFLMSQKTIFRAIFKIIETIEKIIYGNADFVGNLENLVVVNIVKQLIMNPIYLIKKKINFSMAEFVLRNKHKFIITTNTNTSTNNDNSDILKNNINNENNNVNVTNNKFIEEEINTNNTINNTNSNDTNNKNNNNSTISNTNTNTTNNSNIGDNNYIRNSKPGEIEEYKIFQFFNHLKIHVSNIVLFLYKLSEDSFGRYIISKYFLNRLKEVHSLGEKLTVVKIVRNLVVNKEEDFKLFGKIENWETEMEVILVQILYMKKHIQIVSDEYNLIVKEIEKGSNYRTKVVGELIGEVLRNVKEINI